MAFEYKVLRTLFKQGKQKETQDKEKYIMRNFKIKNGQEICCFFGAQRFSTIFRKFSYWTLPCPSSVHFKTPHFTPLKTPF
jgi:hypothetical protein